jgi:uncharacterized membrane protein
MGVLLNVVTLAGCGIMALAGVGILALGLYGLVGGMHGGPIVAGIIALVGATVAFAGYHLARLWLKSEQTRQKEAANINE